MFYLSAGPVSPMCLHLSDFFMVVFESKIVLQGSKLTRYALQKNNSGI